jgi:hypothetical protein
MRKLLSVAALLGGSLLPLMPAVAAPVVVPMPTGGVVTGPHHRYYHNGRYYNHRYYHRGHWYYR